MGVCVCGGGGSNKQELLEQMAEEGWNLSLAR